MVPLDLWHWHLNSSGSLCLVSGAADADVDFVCGNSVGAGIGAYVEASICRKLLQIVGLGLIFLPSPPSLLLKGNFDDRVFWVDRVLGWLKGVGGMKSSPVFLVPESVATLVDSLPGAEFLEGPKWELVTAAAVYGKLNAGGLVEALH